MNKGCEVYRDRRRPAKYYLYVLTIIIYSLQIYFISRSIKCFLLNPVLQYTVLSLFINMNIIYEFTPFHINLQN